MRAVEVTGKIDAKGRLTLDHELVIKNKKVRVIILTDEVEEEDNEKTWLSGVTSNPAFDFLREEEDIYSIKDGKPFSE